MDNYEFFQNKIIGTELSSNHIYEAVGKLQLVNITLDRSIDDPQLIFESLNSTGVDLSQADLIRNHMLMGLDTKTQTHVYEHIWYPMEKLFAYEKKSDLMNKFFRVRFESHIRITVDAEHVSLQYLKHKGDIIKSRPLYT